MSAYSPRTSVPGTLSASSSSSSVGGGEHRPYTPTTAEPAKRKDIIGHRGLDMSGMIESILRKQTVRRFDIAYGKRRGPVGERPNIYAFIGQHSIGKSTTLAMVADRLRELDYTVQVIEENLDEISRIVNSGPSDDYHMGEITEMLHSRFDHIDRTVDFVLIDRGIYDSVPYTATLMMIDAADRMSKETSAEGQAKIAKLLAQARQSVPAESVEPINLVYIYAETDDELHDCFDFIGKRGRDWELPWTFEQYKQCTLYMAMYYNILAAEIRKAGQRVGR